MGINQTIKHKADTVVPVKGTPKNSKALFYVPNQILHKDLNVPTVADLGSTRCKSFYSSFQSLIYFLTLFYFTTTKQQL